MARNNLYTGGGEFTLSNGKPYVGSYHVHKDKGAMVGATHTSSSHALLKPVNESVEIKVNKLKSAPNPAGIPSSSRRSPSRPSPTTRSSRSTGNNVFGPVSGY